MKRVLLLGLVLLAGAWLAAPADAGTPTPWTQVTGKEFDGAIVPSFYLEGNAIPVQKRNAAMLKTPCGKRMVFALLDTSGYSTEVQQKYHGLVTTEKKLSLGGAEVPVGVYGLGLEKAEAEGGAPSEAPAKVSVYDIAGQKVAEGTAEYDAKLAQPVPLQVVLEEGKQARLYLGRYCIKLK
jgi:hypothetical protein